MNTMSEPSAALLDRTGTTAAVIVTHNRVELLKGSLGIVCSQTHPVDKVIVVDNGADDAVRALVEETAGDRAVYVPSKTNLGGAGGFALGFLTALSLGMDAVWCADDDGRPADENVLETLYSVAEANGLAEVSPTSRPGSRSRCAKVWCGAATSRNCRATSCPASPACSTAR